MKFSLKLKELREVKGLSQRELANALNIGVGSVGMWESTDRIPNAKQLNLLADFFNVTVDELLGRDELTPTERAAGVSHTRKENITPLEEDLLFVFRDIGKKFGTQAQRDYITVGENMLKLK